MKPSTFKQRNKIGSSWARKATRELRRNGFSVGKFGIEDIFGIDFCKKLHAVEPYCRIRNLPDAVIVRGNMCAFIEFKSRNGTNTEFWSVNKASFRAVRDISTAFGLPGYFYFPNDTVMECSRMTSIYNKNINNGKPYFLVNQHDCSTREQSELCSDNPTIATAFVRWIQEVVRTITKSG